MMTEKKYKDPVCNMNVNPETAKGHSHYQETDYYFCSVGCKTKFDTNPQNYLQQPIINGLTESKLKSKSGVWTCPMHPQIIRDGPGSCPICGMALEPKDATVEEDHTELNNMKKRFWVSVALTIPLFILSMGDLLPGKPISKMFSHEVMRWLELILATPVVLWGGLPFFGRGLAITRQSIIKHVYVDQFGCECCLFV